jgi:hypothetical protein
MKLESPPKHFISLGRYKDYLPRIKRINQQEG